MQRAPGAHSAGIDYDRCSLYRPGHQVHFIQARLASEMGPETYRRGEILSVGDDGWIVAEFGGEPMRMWNHDPARARACFAESGGVVGLSGYGVLHAPTGAGRRYCICVATDVSTPCAGPPASGSSPADLARMVVSHGGVVVPGTEALRHLQD